MGVSSLCLELVTGPLCLTGSFRVVLVIDTAGCAALNDMNLLLLAFAHVEPCMIKGLGNNVAACENPLSFHNKAKRPAISCTANDPM